MDFELSRIDGAGERSFVFWGTAESKGPVRTYSDSLEKPRSVPMQSYLRKCDMVLGPHLHGWVQSSSELLRELWWKCTTSAECKTDISAVLTVMSGLDPHKINKLKVGCKSYFDYFLWPCWVPTISVLTLAYCCSEGESCGEDFWRCCWVLGVRNPQSIACEVWSLHFQDKLYNSDSLLIVVILFYVILLLIIHL